MYSTSADFQTKIKDDIRIFHWSGVINTPTPISFVDKDVITGQLTRSISGEKLEIGSVYASQLTLEVNLPNVSRYELYGCEISLTVQLEGASDVVPMGEFIITEANQSASKISITAYDAMIKFDDVAFSPSLHNTIQSPYAWLSEMCLDCGVTLGSTSAEIEGLANGNRNTGFADVVSDVSTWRDVLGYLGAYLGAFAYIGRDGLLYMGVYKSISDDTVPARFRLTSNLSDFRTTYDGLYATYKDGGVQEYVSNSNTGGIVLDIGVNPFLQFSDQTNRLNALQEIVDKFNGIYYVPYASEMPLIPVYDPADVLTFIDNQAGAYDVGAITEITYNIGGTMTVNCSGDNPRLTSAQDRFSKTVAGLSKDYNNGQETGAKNFWLLHTENTSALTVGNSKTLVARIDWEQTVDVQRMGFMFTAEATLSATATVKVLITVDDEASYEFEVTEEKAMIGKRVFTSTCGFRVTGKTTHSALVYMTVTDTPTIWSDLV